MRSSDFSKAPIKAQGESMFVGATHYKGPHAWFVLMFTWVRLERMLKKPPGYCWHKTYYEFPFTLGTIAAFRDNDSMLRFARSKHHRNLMQWATKNRRNADGGYIRLFEATENGYTNGRWRAEDDEWAHIERFTETTKEADAGKTAPYVNQGRARAEAQRKAATGTQKATGTQEATGVDTATGTADMTVEGSAADE